jgi:hypothetical protein
VLRAQQNACSPDPPTSLKKPSTSQAAIPPSLDTIFSNYINFSKPAFETYIAPTKQLADIILPRHSNTPNGEEAGNLGSELIAEGLWDDLKGLRPSGISAGRRGRLGSKITILERDIMGEGSYYETV